MVEPKRLFSRIYYPFCQYYPGMEQAREFEFNRGKTATSGRFSSRDVGRCRTLDGHSDGAGQDQRAVAIDHDPRSDIDDLWLWSCEGIGLSVAVSYLHGPSF